jgi:hypothetical protein
VIQQDKLMPPVEALCTHRVHLIKVAYVVIGIVEGGTERRGTGGSEIRKTSATIGRIPEKSSGIPVDVLWRRSVSGHSYPRGKRAHRKRSVQTPIKLERGLHGAWGFGPYGCLISARVPKGGIVCTGERVHDALAVRVSLVIVECRYEESGFVECNAEVRMTLFNGRGVGVSLEARLRE